MREERIRNTFVPKLVVCKHVASRNHASKGIHYTRHSLKCPSEKLLEIFDIFFVVRVVDIPSVLRVLDINLSFFNKPTLLHV